MDGHCALTNMFSITPPMTYDLPSPRLDVTPPSIECPTELYVEYHNTSDMSVPMTYPYIPISDYVGVVDVTYNPPEGTMVNMRVPITVTVRAYDAAGNMDTCDFIYIGQRECLNSCYSYILLPLAY